MTERIKELIAQAKFIAEETINRQLSSNLELNTFAEKFAELVVKECSEYVGNKGMLAGGGCTIVGEEILMIADGLHKHFGVEE